MPDNSTTDRMERVREKAREVERTTDELYGSGGAYAAGAFVAGGHRFRTLTDAEWKAMRETVARDHFAVGAEIAAKQYGLEEPVNYDGLGPIDKEQTLTQAEAAMRAVGLRKEGE